MAVKLRQVISLPRYIIVAGYDSSYTTWSGGFNGIVTRINSEGFFYKICTTQDAVVQKDEFFYLGYTLADYAGVPVQVGDNFSVHDNSLVGDAVYTEGPARPGGNCIDAIKVSCTITEAIIMSSVARLICCTCLDKPLLNMQVSFFSYSQYTVSNLIDKNGVMMISPWAITSLLDWATISVSSGTVQITNVSGTDIISFNITQDGYSLPARMHSSLKNKIETLYGISINNAYVDLLQGCQHIPTVRAAIRNYGN